MTDFCYYTTDGVAFSNRLTIGRSLHPVTGSIIQSADPTQDTYFLQNPTQGGCDDQGTLTSEGDSRYYDLNLHPALTGPLRDPATQATESPTCDVVDRDAARAGKEAEVAEYAERLFYSNCEIPTVIAIGPPEVPAAAANWRMLLNITQRGFRSDAVLFMQVRDKNGQTPIYNRDVGTSFINTNTGRPERYKVSENVWDALATDVGQHSNKIENAIDQINDDITQFYNADDPAGIARILVTDPAYGWPLAWGINDPP